MLAGNLSPDAPRRLPRARTPYRVLLVDDNDLYSSLIEAILADEPVQVLVAHRLSDARAVLAAQQVDCLLVDRHLPDGDGVEAVAGLREAGGGIPAIVLSGDPDPRLAETAERAGASAMLLKGDELDGLVPLLAALAVAA
jgi:CheY-like chemotaxis protein